MSLEHVGNNPLHMCALCIPPDLFLSCAPRTDAVNSGGECLETANLITLRIFSKEISYMKSHIERGETNSPYWTCDGMGNSEAVGRVHDQS